MKQLLVLAIVFLGCRNPVAPKTVLEGKWRLVEINNGFIGKITQQPEIGYEEVFDFTGNQYQRSKNGKLEQTGTFSVRTEKQSWGEMNFIDYDDNTQQSYSLNNSKLHLDMRTPKGAMIADAPTLSYQKIQ